MHILRHRGVPVYSVSSIFRPDQIFFRWYGYEYRNVLNCITHFFVQNEQSKELLHSIGIDDVDVTGDTRFDRVMQIASQSKDIPVVETFKDSKKVFVAGSSWLPDEEIFIPYLNAHPDWKVIIAPHVIDEEHLKQIEALLQGRKVLRYSVAQGKGQEELRQAEVLIIDCFGLLSSIYKYGEVAYVGGGFGVSIHNLPEAAVWSMPVIFGPNNKKFKEAYELKTCGGGIEISGAEDFRNIMDEFAADQDKLAKASQAAGEYVKTHSGATEKLLQLLRQSKK